MTKGVLVEQILRLFYGGDIPDEDGFVEEDVALLIGQAASYLAKTDIWNTMKMEGMKILDGYFISTYESVAVKYNEKRDNYYLQLPAKSINLPSGLGCYQISPMKDEESAFIPLKNGSLALYKNSRVSYLEGNVGFVQEGQKVVLMNFDAYKTDVTEVLVKMVADISDIGDDDELALPGDYEGLIIDWVLSKLRNPTGPDVTNDREISTPK